jgi:hypothetical protein
MKMLDFISEENLRYLAIAGAVILFGWPLVSDQAKKIWSNVPKKMPSLPRSDSSLGDMRIVLDLASRLQSRGNAEGVDLCQQLIDVMLNTKNTKK